MQDSELRYLTFLYACPLTVLFGAERAGEEWIGSRESLTVHLVGARRAELRHLQGWEMVACRLPKLKRLKLVFVGDEAITSRDMPEEFSFKGKDLQAERKGLDIVYSFPPPMLYQARKFNCQPKTDSYLSSGMFSTFLRSTPRRRLS